MTRWIKLSKGRDVCGWNFKAPFQEINSTCAKWNPGYITSCRKMKSYFNLIHYFFSHVCFCVIILLLKLHRILYKYISRLNLLIFRYHNNWETSVFSAIMVTLTKDQPSTVKTTWCCSDSLSPSLSSPPETADDDHRSKIDVFTVPKQDRFPSVSIGEQAARRVNFPVMLENDVTFPRITGKFTL